MSTEFQSTVPDLPSMKKSAFVPVMDCRAMSKSISIIGTGDFGKAIGKRLVSSGYDVTYGSRRPGHRNLVEADHALAQARVKEIRSAIDENDIIVLAIRVANFLDIAATFEKELSGKIIIDVSNRAKSVKVLTSNAEFLQTLLPKATVVKAFNVISAYALDTHFAGNPRVVPIASDNCQARVKVQDIARNMGFQPFDAGMLVKAREMETSLATLFPLWRFPLFTALVIFVVWWVYIVYLYFVKETAFNWEQLFVKLLNKPLCMTAITMLGLTYLPGCLAGFFQLKNGTKHKRFPSWLDFWLKSRKQLGLTCFALASMHAFISAMLLSPTYYSSWFHKANVVIPLNMTSDVVIKLPVTSWMTWKGEIACLAGVLTFAILCILAVTSLPTVADTLNWVEWRFIQSRLGYLALFLAVSHAYVMGMPAWLEKSNFFYMLHSITFMSSLMPSIVLALRFSLSLPVISHRLSKIRAGWESRSATAGDEERDIGDRGCCSDHTRKAGAIKPIVNGKFDVNELHSVSDARCRCINNRKPSSCCAECEEGQNLRKENVQGRKCCADGPNNNNNNVSKLHVVRV